MPGQVVHDPAPDVPRVGDEQELVAGPARSGRNRSGSVAWWSGETGTRLALAIWSANRSEATKTRS